MLVEKSLKLVWDALTSLLEPKSCDALLLSIKARYLFLSLYIYINWEMSYTKISLILEFPKITKNKLILGSFQIYFQKIRNMGKYRK